MSLATRCIACGTIFRVIQDQLKISEGWVRCGRCDEVFNAIEGLFDLERDAPPNWTPPPAPPSPPAAVVSANFVMPSAPPENNDDVLELGDEDRINSRFFHPEQDDVEKPPSQAISQRDRVEFADARFNDELLSQIDPHLVAPPPSSAPLKKKRRRPSSDDKKRNQNPAFVEAARRKALWQSTPMRVALTGLLIVLLVSLALQVSFHFRDLLAAKWPVTRQALTPMCRWLNCQLEWPRAMIMNDEIRIDSNTLSPAYADTYRLTVVVRNRQNMTVATPWLDVTLYDPRDSLVSRRIFSVADMQANPAIPGSSETTLQIFFSTNNRPIKNYAVDIFYP